MGKKVIAYIVVVFISICAIFSFDVLGNSHIKIFVNGEEVVGDVHLINDRTFLPVRAISEALGADVQWDAKKREVHIYQLSNEDSLLPEIIKEVSPSVVAVIGNLKKSASYYGSSYSEEIVHGTGVIIKSTGEILTNAHVVKDIERIVVVLSNGEGFEAVLKNIDEESDLAVIKINKQGLIPAKFGNQEDVIIGRKVIAIGTPVSFSLRNSASLGIISGINRSIDSSYRLIQTDAAINPGNSGGPLINLNGEVIGINSNKYAGEGIEGLGFSIPIETVKYVLDHFEKYGKVIRASLGVEMEEDWAAKLGLPSNAGLTITKVKEDSSAKENGLVEGDVILSVNGIKVNNLVDYNETMKNYLPGEQVTVKVNRNGVITDFIITLGN